jgi:hypothetical protein
MTISTGLQGDGVNGKLLMTQGDSTAKIRGYQFRAISEHKKSGLILYKTHHAEFAGPGAAIGSPVEQNYKAIIALGAPELVSVSTYEARQKAYSRRIQWIRWLQAIIEQPDPILRAEKLLSSFEAFFDRQMIATLPDEALAALIGVLPQTMQAVRFQYYGLDQPDPDGFPRDGSSQGKSGGRSDRSPGTNTEQSISSFSTYSFHSSVYNFSEGVYSLPHPA